MTVFTTTKATASSTYSDDDDLDAQYGKTNVDKWADLNNDEDEGEVLARRQWARDRAYDYINARLLGGPYEVPFSAPDSVIVTMEAALAGVYLYESRGVTDYDQNTGRAQHALVWQKRAADEQIRDILARRLRLGGSLTIPASYPQVIEDEEADVEETLG